jgi:hypothetical protein
MLGQQPPPFRFLIAYGDSAIDELCGALNIVRQERGRIPITFNPVAAQPITRALLTRRALDVAVHGVKFARGRPPAP